MVLLVKFVCKVECLILNRILQVVRLLRIIKDPFLTAL